MIRAPHHLKRNSPSIDVHVADSSWHNSVPQLVSRVRNAAAIALAYSTQSPSDNSRLALTILLTGDQQLHELNARYRGKDKPTNVLAFPASDGSAYLGDIAIAFGTAAREARTGNQPLSEHLLHLVVHGVLHLLGYDHEMASEAAVMESLEAQILGAMDIPDPYADRQSVMA